MTGHQFDVIVTKLETILNIQSSIVEKINKQNEFLKELKQKTVVISDVDKQIEQLRLDVGSLKDEQEA